MLTLHPPPDYLLKRDVCSYGYFLLAPNHWSPKTQTFTTVLDIGEKTAVRADISQPSNKPGGDLAIRTDRPLTKPQSARVKSLLTRMLNLQEPAATLAEFHRVDPRFAASGRGRVMRSPTFFEDVIKTVTSCNVTWPSTITMNRRLCEVVGLPLPSQREGPGVGSLVAQTTKVASSLHAFPTAAKLARVRPASLRARCSVGYRDARIVELAKMFVRGDIDPAWFENPATPDDAIHEALLELPGIGPYAAANIMQLLGRYSRLPLDTESVRHGKTLLGFTGTSAQIMKKVHAHFEPFGHHRFRSYWFELWAFYENKRGPAWTWERETTGATFTASKLVEPSPQAKLKHRGPRRATEKGKNRLNAKVPKSAKK